MKSFWKKILRAALVVVAIGMTAGSCVSMCVAGVFNKEGDGLAPAQTLTATLLGFARDCECDFVEDQTRRIDDEAWECEFFASSLRPIWWRQLPPERSQPVWSESYSKLYREEWPVATFVAQWMNLPFEWVLCLLLLRVAFNKQSKQSRSE